MNAIDKVVNKHEGHSLNSPAYSTITPINVDGIEGRRLMTVYKTIGCEYDKKNKGCTMCDFYYYANPNTKDKNVKEQHKQTLEMLKNVNSFIHFDLLTLGNFYNNNEVSSSLREHLLKSLATQSTVKRVLTEARRQYISVDKLVEAKKCLNNNQVLEYALGYETKNEKIRNKILKKATPEKHLDDSLKMCKEANVDFVAYVLIKPQSLNESEAIEEAVETAIHVLETAKKYNVKARIAFEPLFIIHNKPIEKLWKEGKITPPKLWTVAEVIIKTAERLGLENTKGKLFIGLSDENLSEGRMTSNNCECDNDIRKAIQDFNGHQSVNQLKSELNCPICRDAWVKEIY